MLNYRDGLPIAIDGNKILYLDEGDYSDESDSENEDGKEILTHNTLEPLLNIEERSFIYIAGKAKSGKTTFALMMIKRFLQYRKDIPFFLFSRTYYKNDPAYKGMKNVHQVMLDDSLMEDPINIETDLPKGAIILFDDCNTIQNDKIKKQIEKLVRDIIECGRKLNLWIVLTNHLLIPDEKKLARLILLELDCLVVFPRSGAKQQIRYILDKYFELDKEETETIVKSKKTRWTLIHKNHPMFVIYNHGAYMLN